MMNKWSKQRREKFQNTIAARRNEAIEVKQQPSMVKDAVLLVPMIYQVTQAEMVKAISLLLREGRARQTIIDGKPVIQIIE